MKNWFGEGCVYLRAHWESSTVITNAEPEPDLKFCTNPTNPNPSEGNCTPELCPIKFKE